MTPRRFIVLLVLALLCYLGLYTWNQRTGTFDRLAANTGLEVIGAVLRPMAWVHERVVGTWDNYIDLVGARDELFLTQAELESTTWQLGKANEEAAELARLRALLTLEVPQDWQKVGARVLASRLGPHGVLHTITIDHGYLTGAGAGVPVATHHGIVGRVLEAGPFTSLVLLALDGDSRIAVVSQESRTQGILVGGGIGAPMEMLFVPINNTLQTGEILVTSGLDGVYPKGIPVARVETMERSKLSMFQIVTAKPLARMDALEEVLLLQAPVWQYMSQAPHGLDGTESGAPASPLQEVAKP